jgi:sugar phosphate isomerase/epimerase
MNDATAVPQPRVSFSTIALIEHPVESVIELAAGWGFDGIDLCVSPRGHIASDACDRTVADLRRRADAYGLRIAGLYGYGGRRLIGAECAGDEALIRAEIRCAALLGATSVRVFAGHEGEAAENAAGFAAALRPLCAEAQGRGIRIVLPNHNDLAGTASRAAVLFRLLGHGSAGLIFNGPTLELAHHDPLAEMELAWPLIDRIELKDFRRDAAGRPIPVALGEGEASLRPLLARLAARNFGGWITIHYLRNLYPDAEDAREALLRSLAWIRQALAGPPDNACRPASSALGSEAENNLNDASSQLWTNSSRTVRPPSTRID